MGTATILPLCEITASKRRVSASERQAAAIFTASPPQRRRRRTSCGTRGGRRWKSCAETSISGRGQCRAQLFKAESLGGLHFHIAPQTSGEDRLRQDGDLFFDSSDELSAAMARSTRGDHYGKLPVRREADRLGRRPRTRFSRQRVRKLIRGAVRLLAREMARQPTAEVRRVRRRRTSSPDAARERVNGRASPWPAESGARIRRRSARQLRRKCGSEPKIAGMLPSGKPMAFTMRYQKCKAPRR